MMHVITEVEGLPGVRAPIWPQGWPIPRVGELVHLWEPQLTLTVAAVTWCPQGSRDDSRGHVRLLMTPPKAH